tara:strand:- start:2792 stop:4480 length:1689 start_codon:yes stop_codon:yes gene_type:complete
MNPFPPSCFTPFCEDISGLSLPDKFTFPFYYQPHPLCILAAAELQKHLQTQDDWYHNFGLSSDPEQIIGKMFGVLLVKNAMGEVGYLSAFSGKLADTNHLSGFVPPVFDMLASDSFFHAEQKIINNITTELNVLLCDDKYLALKASLAKIQLFCDSELASQRHHVITNRAKRKEQREALQAADPKYSAEIHLQLAQQSIDDKLRFAHLKIALTRQVDDATNALSLFDKQIDKLKQHRKTLSAQLQHRIFEQYKFLNARGAHKSLAAIFSDTVMRTPPAGAGECAAPKLLHHAYKHNLQPLAMAEFWWGASPKSQVRRHTQFYPACMGKCQPILDHMLLGLEVDENLLLQNTASDKKMDIIYQDDSMLVVNKPTQLLSVPGKHIADSVFSRVKALFPQATGSLIVHRLDMSTSGLMVIALTTASHKILQKQFINRQVSKRYVALIEGLLEEDEGVITLPLTGDFYDRPRQCVCEQTGKAAHTTWQIIERHKELKRSKVFLHPKTGRTHQLRVHCAHERGLHMPIVGDDLYGTSERRLHLHAQSLGLYHPVTQAWLELTCEPDF